MSMLRFKQGATPKLSETDKTEMEALFKCPDGEIGYSDIPELDNDFLRKAVSNPLNSPPTLCPDSTPPAGLARA